MFYLSNVSVAYKNWPRFAHDLVTTYSSKANRNLWWVSRHPSLFVGHISRRASRFILIFGKFNGFRKLLKKTARILLTKKTLFPGYNTRYVLAIIIFIIVILYWRKWFSGDPFTAVRFSGYKTERKKYVPHRTLGIYVITYRYRVCTRLLYVGKRVCSLACV